MKEKLIFFYPSLSSFIRDDIDALSSSYEVIHHQLPWRSKVRLLLNFLIQFFFLLKNLRNTKAIVISFAGYHSFLPVIFAQLFRKKVFIVLNGTDSVAIKELNYGSHLKAVLRWFCKFSIKYATELWPVSESLISGKNEFTGRFLEYGISVSFPKIKTPYLVIPNGFNSEKWPFDSSIIRENRIVSVVSSEKQFALKGIDLILELSNSMTEFEFIIVGMDKPDSARVNLNVHFTGKLDQSELSHLFCASKYYLQLSSFEGFGCSLCEAMLSGCIPVGSNVNAIPEIIDGTGKIIFSKDVKELEIALKVLEDLSKEDLYSYSLRARKKIIDDYSMEKRLKAIKSRI